MNIAASETPETGIAIETESESANEIKTEAETATHDSTKGETTGARAHIHANENDAIEAAATNGGETGEKEAAAPSRKGGKEKSDTAVGAVIGEMTEKFERFEMVEVQGPRIEEASTKAAEAGLLISGTGTGTGTGIAMVGNLVVGGGIDGDERYSFSLHRLPQ
jgi:hypothetical protein